VTSLEAVDPVELAEAAGRVGNRMRQYAARWGTVAETQTPFSPVVDGHVLPADPWTALGTGTAADVPLVVGHTRDEIRSFTRAAGQDHRDWLCRMPSARLAYAGAAAGAPTHLFELAYTVPQRDGILGAPHSADHPLVFGNFCGGIADRYYVQPVAADTEGLGNRMRRAWADFAHTGNPGWAPFTPETLRTMVFDTESTEQRYPHAVNLEAYGRDFPEVLDLLV